MFTQSISFEIPCPDVNKESEAHLCLIAICLAVKETGRGTVCHDWPLGMGKSSGFAMDQFS